MKLSSGPGISPYAEKYGSSSFVLVLLLLAVSFPLTASQSTSDSSMYQTRFSPSMAIIVVVLVAALFLMAFFSIYIRHCSTASDATASVTARTVISRSRRAPRGLDLSVINTFPTLEYFKVKGLKIGKGALECAVCLCEFEDDEMLRLIPKCDHVFHPDCIDAWLASHTTCPVCRANLIPEPNESIPHIPQLEIEPETEPEEIHEIDVERGDRREEEEPQVSLEPPQVKVLNRNRTRGSRSSRIRRLFPRSNSTGHSLVHPGEDTERFTLRLPAEVRKQIMSRQLNRAMSMMVLPSEGISRQGCRTGDGSSRGMSLKGLDRSFRSDRWTFNRVPRFFSKSGSFRSPRTAGDSKEGPSNRPSTTEVI
ncbi:hypothetical protein SAY86_012271 [Trapa natans]|uniref:RING-type E3 ubiquitin transferase n=1 Tax=Trapa natans TaxID=22666 RepID=A0AAN7LX81_TRANT|nr:hypothetical protein SAY86_012271 [Trapa natans]